MCRNFFLFWSLWPLSRLVALGGNVTVGDAGIPWPMGGPNPWSTAPSFCAVGDQAHFAYLAGMSVNYTFTGTAVYLGILRTPVTGIYVVNIDDQELHELDGYHAGQGICDVQFNRTGLNFQQHRIAITLTRTSPQAAPNATRPYLELDEIIYSVPDSSSSSSASTSTASPTIIIPPTVSIPAASTTTSTTGAADTAAGPGLRVAGIAGIAAGIALALVGLLAGVGFLLWRRRRNARAVNVRDPPAAARLDLVPVPFRLDAPTCCAEAGQPGHDPTHGGSQSGTYTGSHGGAYTGILSGTYTGSGSYAGTRSAATRSTAQPSVVSASTGVSEVRPLLLAATDAAPFRTPLPSLSQEAVPLRSAVTPPSQEAGAAGPSFTSISEADIPDDPPPAYVEVQRRRTKR